MTFAAKIADVWSVLPVGQPVTLNEISVSWETLNTMSVRSREEFGAYEVPEPDPAPEGKVEVSRALKPTGRRPVWDVTYADIPAPGPAPTPESVTNSDWRVGLILWPGSDGKSRFDEVEAKVIAARESGTTEGKIVWQRWEYANDVYRTELMALHETFGFSTEEVDESLSRAAAVSENTRAQANAVLAARTPQAA